MYFRVMVEVVVVVVVEAVALPVLVLGAEAENLSRLASCVIHVIQTIILI